MCAANFSETYYAPRHDEEGNPSRGLCQLQYNVAWHFKQRVRNEEDLGGEVSNEVKR